MNISVVTGHLYFIPLIPIVVVAVLSVAYWIGQAVRELRAVVLRLMVKQAGRHFGRRDVQRWLTESEAYHRQISRHSA